MDTVQSSQQGKERAMNRILRVSCILLVALAVSAVGCKKGDKNKGKEKAKVTEPKKAPPPPPKKLTPEENAKHYAECWAAFAKKDKAGLGKCYADNAKLVSHDHLPPVEATGRDNVLAAIEANFWTGFSDITGEPQLTMVSGNKIVAIAFYKATNSGPIGPIPATNKEIGMLAGAYTETNDQGQAVVDEHWMDQNTIAGQLGLMPKEAPPVIPVMEEGWPEKVVAIAADDDKEHANTASATAYLEAFNKHDVKALLDFYADDAVVEIWGMKPTEGKKDIKKGLAGYFKGIPDVKEEAVWTIAAGDYVAVSSTSTGTFSGTMPGPPKMKGTGKSFEMSDLTVVHIVDGKIEHEWIFGNGYSWAVQLGIAPSPEEMMKKMGGGAPPAKGAAPAKKGAAPVKTKAPPTK